MIECDKINVNIIERWREVKVKPRLLLYKGIWKNAKNKVVVNNN